ncbi:MAG: NTP transferase domain-containing protein [Tepidisphaeraceae bacterium]
MSRLMRDATIVLLAGGEGRRMGGPKADLLIDGEPILLRARRRFAAHRMILSLRPAQRVAGEEAFDGILYDQQFEASAGELALSLVERLGTSGVLLPVDMPLMDAETLAQLGKALDETPNAVAALFVRSGEIEPMPLAFRPTLAAVLRCRTEAGDRSLRGLAAEPLVRSVQLHDDKPGVWTHLNEPADVARSGLQVSRKPDISP